MKQLVERAAGNLVGDNHVARMARPLAFAGHLARARICVLRYLLNIGAFLMRPPAFGLRHMRMYERCGDVNLAVAVANADRLSRHSDSSSHSHSSSELNLATVAEFCDCHRVI